MNAPIRVADKAAVVALRSQAHDVRMLAPGLVNDIFLVDGVEVVRIPKLESDRQSLLFEAAVLHDLEGKVTLAIPKPIEVAPDGGYGVFSYVAGKVLGDDAVSRLDRASKVKIGSDLALFMREINSVVSIDRVRALRYELGLATTDEKRYYDEALEHVSRSSQKLSLLYRHYYQLMRSLRSDEPDRQIIIHGDLHAGNLVFDKVNRLTGVIDFGDFEVGTVYDEFYQIYSLDGEVAKTVIEGLEGAFGPINLELVRTRAILHELSVLVRPKRDEAYDKMRADVAHRRLERWLGDNWGEL